jgi:hypothetical protein
MVRLILAVLLVAALSITVNADILVLRNGTRLEGELLVVRGGVIEFEERRGGGRARRHEFDRDEVARIEFDRPRTSDRSFAEGRRPAGLRERQVAVAASAAWTDTGIDVRAGQTVYFEASGQVRWGRDRRDGPEGEDGSPANPNRPIPNRPAAALIGKIGSGATDYFFIGDDRGAVRMRVSGRLFLGINDDYIADNSGSFRVIVHY